MPGPENTLKGRGRGFLGLMERSQPPKWRLHCQSGLGPVAPKK
jgi:hypothetical protein